MDPLCSASDFGDDTMDIKSESSSDNEEEEDEMMEELEESLVPAESTAEEPEQREKSNRGLSWCEKLNTTRYQYEREYNTFKSYLTEKNITEITDSVVYDYFHEKGSNMTAATLQCKYSMLKVTLMHYDGVDIQDFPKMKAFLKQKLKGYKSKKAKRFTIEEARKFLQDAPDDYYLMMKVALIMGLSGMTKNEFPRLTIDDLEDRQSVIVVSITTSKQTRRSFAILDDDKDGFNPAEMCRKYLALRPAHVTHRRFFLQYRRGKCTIQPVGIHQFGKIPRIIARYLKLPNLTGFTSRSLMLSSQKRFSSLEGPSTFPCRVERVGEAFMPLVLTQQPPILQLKPPSPLPTRPSGSTSTFRSDQLIVNINNESNEVRCNISAESSNSASINFDNIGNHTIRIDVHIVPKLQ